MKLKKIMMGVFCLVFATCFASQTQVGRYSTVLNKPTAAQINPLLAVGQYKFASNVRTVGQAIHQVLSTSGYQLMDEKAINKEGGAVLYLPLPLVNRELGPLSIKDTVSVLIGYEVFDLKINPLHRTINFKVKSTVAKRLEASA